MHRFGLLGLAVLGLTVTGAGGCAVETGPGPARSTASPTTIDDPPPDPPSTRPRPASVALITFAEGTFELDADCFRIDAEHTIITALNSGGSPPRVELYVQAFADQPYLGITVTDDEGTVTYEPTLDRPPPIQRTADVYRIDDVALRADLDLRTGAGVDVGAGTVIVECDGYLDGPPPGFVGD